MDEYTFIYTIPNDKIVSCRDADELGDLIADANLAAEKEAAARNMHVESVYVCDNLIGDRTMNYRMLPLEKMELPEHGPDVPEAAPKNIEIFPAVWDMVIEDMTKRDKMGTDKYGVRLRPFNGRDPLWDAYQEVLDLAVYLRQEIWQRDLKHEQPSLPA